VGSHGIRRKHSEDPSIRYLGVIAGYTPGTRPEIPVELAKDYTAWVLTLHTVQQLMLEDLCEQGPVITDMCATSQLGGATLFERCMEAHFMSLVLPLDHQHFPFIWRVCQQQFDR
jgi:hypothetical protein